MFPNLIRSNEIISQMTLFDECANSTLIRLFNNTDETITSVGSGVTSTNDTSVAYSWILDHTILECVGSRFEKVQSFRNDSRNELYSWMMLFMGALVFFMQTGFAMVCAGCVRRKNMQNTMMKNLLDACIAGIMFYSVGYAFSYGGTYDGGIDGDTSSNPNTFVGTSNFFSRGIEGRILGEWFYQYALSATCVTIVAGTLAERCQMGAYLWYSLVLSGFVFPVVAHALWSNRGFLSISSDRPLNGLGAVDFSGSGVIHVTGGMAALIATIILGPRSGRFTDLNGVVLKNPKTMRGSSIAFQILGTFILWFSWYGFNAGSSLLLSNKQYVGSVAARAVVNTSLAAGFGSSAALIINMYIQRLIHTSSEYVFSVTMAMNGVLAGLVGITAGCATVESWAAVVIGTCSGGLYVLGTNLLIRFRLDDVVDGIPVHLLSGIWGMIATGLFTSPRAMKMAYNTDAHVGLLYELGRGRFNAVLLGNQIIAVLFIVSWTTVTMYPFFKWLDYMKWFRSSGLQEIFGLDLTYHGKILPEAQAEVTEDVAKVQQHQMALIKKDSRHKNHSLSSGEGNPRKSRRTSTTSWSISTESKELNLPDKSKNDNNHCCENIESKLDEQQQQQHQQHQQLYPIDTDDENSEKDDDQND